MQYPQEATGERNPREIEVTLNVRAGVKTLNGNFYSREVLEKALSEAIQKKNVFVILDISLLAKTPGVEEVVGLCSGWMMNEEGVVRATLKIWRDDVANSLTSGKELLSFTGEGKVTPQGVKDFDLKNFTVSLAPGVLPEEEIKALEEIGFSFEAERGDEDAQDRPE